MADWQKGHEDFISRLQDLFDRAEYKPEGVVLPFLSLPEQDILKRILPSHLQVEFDGGYPQAERKIACISRDGRHAEPACLEAFLNPRSGSIRHPDVLGALMGLGIEREQTGDILVSENRLVLFCTGTMKDYILNSLNQAGRVRFQLQEGSPSSVPAVQRQEVQINCASLRMDAVVAALAKSSRKKAGDLIRTGMVKVNDVVLEQNQTLCNNDFVSIRRCGRFRFLGVEKTTRKDRLVLRFEKYI